MYMYMHACMHAYVTLHGMTLLHYITLHNFTLHHIAYIHMYIVTCLPEFAGAQGAFAGDSDIGSVLWSWSLGFRV